jgi:glucose dehydrogenase
MLDWRRQSALVALMLSVLLIPVSRAWGSDGASSPHAHKDWPLIHGDWTNQRYSALAKINVHNARQFGGAWISKTFEDGASTRSAPVVAAGVMYVCAGTRVYALNAKTGQTLWNWQSSVAPSWQGVAVGEGKIFVGLQDGNVVALDQNGGTLLWKQHIGADPPQAGESVTTAPTYARGVVFAGLANGDWALRGRVVALDAKDGHELWHFFTVPGLGEPGHETWDAHNDVWKVGGGGVWQTGAVDPDLALVYFGTGNPVPPFGGEERAGHNLYTVSVLALDIHSCSRCHTDTLKGADQIPPLIGDTFLSHWRGRSVKDLFDRVRATMPQGNPGSLRAHDYLDLIAFMLQANNFPPGSHELSDTSQLSKTTINDDTR